MFGLTPEKVQLFVIVILPGFVALNVYSLFIPTKQNLSGVPPPPRRGRVGGLEGGRNTRPLRHARGGELAPLRLAEPCAPSRNDCHSCCLIL
jgi:hypothetical protein